MELPVHQFLPFAGNVLPNGPHDTIAFLATRTLCGYLQCCLCCTAVWWAPLAPICALKKSSSKRKGYRKYEIK